MIVKKEDLLKEEEQLRNKIKMLKKNIEEIKNILNQVVNKIEIYYNINKDILNKYSVKNRNYNVIKNLNEIKKTIKMYSKI